jgi:hypothetical protein
MSACNILRFDNYVRMQHFVRRSTYVTFRRFWGDVRRESTERLSAALHGTLGSYLRNALHEGNDDTVTCLHIPRAKACGVFSFLLLCDFHCFFL